LSLFSLHILHFISLTPHENTISAIFCRLVCFLTPNLANIIQLLYFYITMNGWRRFQRRFHQIWKQCSVFYLRYCVLRYFVKYGAINATSSSSYVFRLQYPEVIHCRIVPIEKCKTLAVLERWKPPNTVVLSEFKRSNLKVTRKFVKIPLGYMTGGVNIFTKRLLATTEAN
jgi:hypothetical protein